MSDEDGEKPKLSKKDLLRFADKLGGSQADFDKKKQEKEEHATLIKSFETGAGEEQQVDQSVSDTIFKFKK